MDHRRLIGEINSGGVEISGRFWPTWGLLFFIRTLAGFYNFHDSDRVLFDSLIFISWAWRSYGGQDAASV
jgi:hypothetical protein